MKGLVETITDAVRAGLSQLLWNSTEQRFRAPVRLGLTVLVLLAALLVIVLVGSFVEVFLGSTNAIVVALGQLVVLAGLIGALLGATRMIDKRTLDDFGLAFDGRFWRELGVGLCLGVLMVASIVLPGLALGLFSVDGTFVASEGGLLGEIAVGPGLVLGVVLIFAIAGFEECFFRGYLIVNVAEGLAGRFDSTDSLRAGILFSSLFFGFAHAVNPDASLVSTLNITLLGAFLAGCYVVTDSLAIPVGVHVGWNYTLGSVFGLPVSGLSIGPTMLAVSSDGPTLVTGGSFGPEGGLLAFGALAVGIAGLAGWIRWQYDSLSMRNSIVRPDLQRR